MEIALTRFIEISVERVVLRIFIVAIIATMVRSISISMKKSELNHHTDDSFLAIGKLSGAYYFLVAVIVLLYLVNILLATRFSIVYGVLTENIINNVFDIGAAISLFVIFIATVFKYKNCNIFSSLGVKKEKFKKGLLYGINAIFVLFFLRVIVLKYFVGIENAPIINQFKGVAIFSAILLAPIAEELFCRGYLYPIFREKVGVVWGALITSTCFILIHMNWNNWVLIFLLGLIYVFLYERSRSIIAPIIGHMASNTYAVLSDYQQGIIIKNMSGPIIVLLLGIIGLIYMRIKSWREIKNTRSSIP